jgi:hypothetical protein
LNLSKNRRIDQTYSIKQQLTMKFYRYQGVQYATLSYDGDFISSSIPNPKLELYEYNLFKETLKGYWICYGSIVPGNLRSDAIWVSKTGKKRFAYPSKQEALIGFIKRTEKRIKILNHQLTSCNMLLSDAKLL